MDEEALPHTVDLLAREHQAIRGVLDAFERYLDALGAGDDVDPADLARFLGFFREYADLGHHEKEEGLLIPALVRAGQAWDEGPIAQVRREHHRERYLVAALRRAALARAPGEAACPGVVAAAREYVAFLRAHLTLEEGELFPAVRACLSDAAERALARNLARFDREWDEHQDLTFLQQLAAELAVRYPGP